MRPSRLVRDCGERIMIVRRVVGMLALVTAGCVATPQPVSPPPAAPVGEIAPRVAAPATTNSAPDFVGGPAMFAKPHVVGDFIYSIGKRWWSSRIDIRDLRISDDHPHSGNGRR